MLLKENGYYEIDVKIIIDQSKGTERKRKLLQQEYFPYINKYLYYLEEKVLEKAEIRLFQEIKDIEQSIGAEHKISLMLKDEFCGLLNGQGRYKKAKKLNLQVLEIFERTLGVRAWPIWLVHTTIKDNGKKPKSSSCKC